MTYLADLRARILAVSGVSAIIADRVFMQRMPDEAYDSLPQKPCIVYRQSSRQTQLKFVGPDSLVLASVELHVYSKDGDQAENLAKSLLDSLDGWRGTQGSTKFELIQVLDETDLMDLEPGLYRRLIQIQTWYKEL